MNERLRVDGYFVKVRMNFNSYIHTRIATYIWIYMYIFYAFSTLYFHGMSMNTGLLFLIEYFTILTIYFFMMVDGVLSEKCYALQYKLG